MAGKVALITGAGGAIGSEMARLFAREGAAVVVNDIVAEKGQPVAEGICRSGGRAIFEKADVSSAAQVARLVARAQEQFGGLDVLVNNAIVIEGDTTIESLSEAAFDHVLAVCLKGPFLCTRAAIPLMTARGAGSIVTISSINALFGFGHTAYTAAKGGLNAMMRLVAAEYGDRRIRSNIICPGTIETDISMRYWRSVPDSFARLRAMYPMGRIGTPADVAHYALFLASDEAAFVTGSIAVVDGGILAGRKFEF